MNEYERLRAAVVARQQRADDTLWGLTAIASAVAFSLLAYLVADLLAGGKTLTAWLHFVERIWF